jgi:hypothetical protein
VGLPLLALSGDEIVAALERGGLRVLSRSNRATVLTRGCRDVTVPAGPVSGDALREILREAGMSYFTFLDQLEAADARLESGIVPVPRRAR